MGDKYKENPQYLIHTVRESVDVVHLYPVMTFLPWWEWFLFQNDNALVHWKVSGLMSMKTMWIICCALHSYHIWSWLNTYGRFWTNGLPSTVQHHFQNSRRERICFRRVVFNLSNPPQVESMSRQHWISSGSTWWFSALLSHCMVGFPFYFTSASLWVDILKKDFNHITSECTITYMLSLRGC